MTYALVVANVIEKEVGRLPASARRLSDGATLNTLSALTVAEQESCGWFAVVDVAKPADTATDTFDRSLTLVGGKPTATWTQRPKTQAEVDAANAIANEGSVNTYLASAIAATTGTLDQIIATPAAAFTQQGLRDLQAQVKDLARIDRRLIRKLLRQLDATS